MLHIIPSNAGARSAASSPPTSVRASTPHPPPPLPRVRLVWRWLMTRRGAGGLRGCHRKRCAEGTSDGVAGGSVCGGQPNTGQPYPPLWLWATKQSPVTTFSQAKSLDLSSNEIYGKIPQELASLNFLSTLNLSYNMLFGRLP